MPDTADADDLMLAKVRKLLAKAEDPAATTGEAEVYTAKAAALMAAYGIDQALLAHTDADRDQVGDRVVVLDAPYAADKADLLAAVAAPMHCRAVRRVRRTGGRREVSLHLFGHASDLRRVEVLYTSLLLQATTRLAQTPVPHGEHKAAFRRSWLAGFRSAVSRRLQQAEDRARSEAETRFTRAGTSSALVLADRSTAVASVLQQAYPRLRSGRRRVLSGSGLADGRAVGERADLGGVRVETQPRGRLA